MALLVGCSGSGTDSGSSDGGGAGGDAAVPGEAEGAPGSAVDGDTDEERQVVTTARASLSVEDPADGAQQVSELVESVGGRIDERTEQAASGENGLQGAFADLVVRVPSDELTGLLADLEEVGDVDSVSVSRSDVTAQAVDLDARISALQSSVARLQELMEGAGTLQALLAAEQALSDRQAELESLQSQRAQLADQVELSTLSVHLEPFGVAPAGGPDGFLDGFGTGWRSLVTVLAAAVVVVGILLPWLAVGALVTGGVLVPYRWMRRRAAAKTPAASPSPAPAPQPMPPPPTQHPPAPPAPPQG
jgi:Domain of unknown function (DUF4349)